MSMAERLVVLVENDPVLSERVRAVLSAHSFKVDVVADGNELLTSQQLRPVLIILCIDPKRMGWAICNKVKKTVQYRDVPMIVTSQEATDKDFEDHKKLRTRAEEYLHKPYSVEVLLSKIDHLVGLKPANEEGAESLDDAVLEEISVDDAVIEEEIPTAQLISAPVHKRVDQETEDETDAAFAAIGAGEMPPSRQSTPSRQSAPRAVTEPERSRPNSPNATLSAIGTDPALTLPKRPDAPRKQAPPTPGAPAQQPDTGQTLILGVGPDPNATLRPVQSARTPSSNQQTVRLPDPAELKALEQALAEAKARADKAEQQAAFWHDQRDQLASERDQLASERERLSSERGELLSQAGRSTQVVEQSAQEKRQLMAERDELLTERNLLLLERNQIAAERDSLRNSEPPPPSVPPELLAAQARLSAERDSLLSEREQLASERRELQARLERLGTERDELLAGHDRLAADFAQVQARLNHVEQSAAAQAQTPVAAPAELAELENLRRDRQQLLTDLERFRDAALGWQGERTRLLGEIDELKSRPPVVAPAPAPTPGPSSGLLRDRDVINLKEIINKKDKEILDLRDAMDAKDRQVLDARDRAREIERQKRELDEKLLDSERAQLEMQEKLEAVSQDKEVWQEREKGLKSRLEDAQRKLARADEDVQGMRRRVEQETARAEQIISEERRRAEETLAGVQQQHTAALQQLQGERDAREASLAASHQQAVQRERAAAEEEHRALEQRHAQAWAQFEAQYQARFEERMRRHEETLASVQRAHEAQLQELQTQHQQSLGALGAQLEQAKSMLVETQQRYEQALDDQRAQLTHELTVQHDANLSRAVREAEERIRVAANAEKDAVRSERNAFERRAAELDAQLGELQRQYQAAESNLTAYRTHLDEREAELRRANHHLSDREQQLTTLRAENATMQEQIQRAYQRIVGDENQMGRVRRALTIALGVLDEGQQSPAHSDGEDRQQV